jgi:Family of unknown function (DUF5678)
MEKNPKTDKNYQYIKKNWSELIGKYPNKFIIVSDEKVVGFFDTYETAATEAIIQLGEKDFIIQHLADAKFINFVFSS